MGVDDVGGVLVGGLAGAAQEAEALGGEWFLLEDEVEELDDGGGKNQVAGDGGFGVQIECFGGFVVDGGLPGDVFVGEGEALEQQAIDFAVIGAVKLGAGGFEEGERNGVFDDDVAMLDPVQEGGGGGFGEGADGEATEDDVARIGLVGPEAAEAVPREGGIVGARGVGVGQVAAIFAEAQIMVPGGGGAALFEIEPGHGVGGEIPIGIEGGDGKAAFGAVMQGVVVVAIEEIAVADAIEHVRVGGEVIFGVEIVGWRRELVH